MKPPPSNRRELVLAAIATPKTPSEVSEMLGITYGNAYYTLQSLKFERLCHISSWSIKRGHKLAASFVAGEGRDAEIDGMAGQSKAEIVSVDAGLRAAVAAWVKSNEEKS